MPDYYEIEEITSIVEELQEIPSMEPDPYGPPIPYIEYFKLAIEIYKTKQFNIAFNPKTIEESEDNFAHKLVGMLEEINDSLESISSAILEK
jgi:hypothetical protein